MKTYETGIVSQIIEIAPNIFDMTVKCELCKNAVPGQFVMIYPNDKSTLLPRPISICEILEDGIRFVFRIAGKGTKEFSGYKPGKEVKVMGPVGNGYPLDKAEGRKCVLLGGGIGVPPILELAKNLSKNKCDITIIPGYRDANMFLKADFEKYGNTLVATEDGSFGTKGNVMDAIRENGLKPDVIFACGPMPMLRAIKKYAEENNIEAYISLEEKMACGVGACLGCVCKTTKTDSHSHVNNARVCTEGPVFEAREVEI